MITIHITETGKGYASKEKYRVFNRETLHASDMKEAKVKLAERYGNAWRHKRPMYCDKKDGTTVRAGWCVGFRNEDISHVPVNKWLQCDWISFEECKPIEWRA